MSQETMTEPATATKSFWTSRTARFVGGGALTLGLAAGGYGVASATDGASSAGSTHAGAPSGQWHASPAAFGQVASVNGKTTKGSCGSGDTGTFTIHARSGSTVTVAVTKSTKFFEPGSSKGSFAGVCVGRTAGAQGTLKSGTVTASRVAIFPLGVPRPPLPGAIGMVTSVDGSSASSACGAAGKAGEFTLKTRGGSTVTVDVSTATKFLAPGKTTPSFADVCVGRAAGAGGSTTAGVIDAKVVGVLPVGIGGFGHGAVGKVASVNGSTKAKTCGKAGASGQFALTTRRGSVTVDVTSSTKFFDPAAKTASFADVCVGDFAGAAGAIQASSHTVTAKVVGVLPPGGHGAPGLGSGGPGGFGFPGGLFPGGTVFPGGLGHSWGPTGAKNNLGAPFSGFGGGRWSPASGSASPPNSPSQLQ
ncbi:MAG TPA: hypothetical protein VGP46_00330 [Acidimicrobiales bacterium]|nr:hypothetical protein [Acidimicrobiales bacterium]